VQVRSEVGTVTPRFPHITNGQNLAPLLDSALRDLGLDPEKTDYRNLGFGASSRPAVNQDDEAPCDFVVRTPDRLSGYSLSEILGDQFMLMGCNGLNSAGHVVGTGRVARTGPPTIPWLWDGETVRRLGYDGLALALNDRDEVAAVIQTGATQEGGIYRDDELTRAPL
jgi:hypothetical protein